MMDQMKQEIREKILESMQKDTKDVGYNIDMSGYHQLSFTILKTFITEQLEAGRSVEEALDIVCGNITSPLRKEELISKIGDKEE